MTAAVSKQLLPVYDKPMIYYPLSMLMLGGIQDILVITTPHDLPRFRGLLKDGAQWGLRIEYATQPRPEGIAQAFLIGADFIGTDSVTLVLGDNLFYGHELGKQFAARVASNAGATIFTYAVSDPERYGVAEFDEAGHVVSLEEKPVHPKSNFAVTGLYIYDHRVVGIAKSLALSARGELEITDVNKTYLARGELHAHALSRGNAWLDTGTPDALLEAASFVSVIEKRQGLKICCVEEIAYRLGYIDAVQMEALISQLGSSDYARYLRGVKGAP
jgi:glucose-1-phosphate thymidylyltransferase